MTPKPTLWQKILPLLLREAIVALEGINNLLSTATEQLKGVATQQAIAPDQFNPERSWLARGATLWWQGMGWVQQRLPSHLQKRYNRATLTGIAIALFLILLWLHPLSWFQAPARPKATQWPQPSVLVQPRPAPTPMPATPPPPPPAMPKPTPPPPAIASPSPVSDSLTVRQQLLAICDHYSNALNPTLTLTPSEQRLELMLANGWYDLSPTKQDQLAQSLWQAAHDLGYQTVIVVDRDGRPLVRDPVVGENAIVVRRKLI